MLSTVAHSAVLQQFYNTDNSRCIFINQSQNVHKLLYYWILGFSISQKLQSDKPLQLTK